MNSSPKKRMNHEIISVSKYVALKTAKYTLSVLLLLMITYCMMTGKDSLPAFYILAANHLFPVVIHYLTTSRTETAIAQKKAKKEAEQYLLPHMVKRHQYSFVDYQCNSMAFLLNCLFLYLWQRRMIHQNSFGVLTNVPTGILILILSIRVIGSVVMFFKIKHELI